MTLSAIHREMVLRCIEPDNTFYFADEFRKRVEEACRLSGEQCQAALDSLVQEGILRFFPKGLKINDRYKCQESTTEMELAKEGDKDISYFHRKILLGLIPDNGESIANDDLMARSGLGEYDESDYWDAVDRLADEGLIVRGGGFRGSVSRTRRPMEIEDERALYEPFRAVVETEFPKHWGFDSQERRVEITAENGPRRNRGIYSRPDVTLLVIKTYTYSPGRRLDVTTFELKTANNWDDASAFEASGHRRFSHFSYLVIHLPSGVLPAQQLAFKRVVETCNHTGVGLIVCGDIRRYSTYEVRVEASRSNPDPALVDTFINDRISKRGREWLANLQ